MSPASGNWQYDTSLCDRHVFWVSIQLMSPASGNGSMTNFNVLPLLAVSIQLMSPASGNNEW